MVFAAAGLSAEIDTDPCSDFPGFPEGSGSSSAYQFWPPGVKCTYMAPNGRTAIVLQDGHPVAFFAILAAGLLLVLGRRSKLAIATAFVFGAGGLAGLFLGFLPIPLVALWVGVAARPAHDPVAVRDGDRVRGARDWVDGPVLRRTCRRSTRSCS